ncbi:ATP-binding protein [Sinanaerobacter sp. ZZT-01]|uniref:ATP-binding protein n=1 Tax=Sinanaerobacter sp. ZZT-01 TaxID=3111540 RepID=UPI002D78D707|nr:4Fe-4S dicluster domain-containing protein [Sinanaerobacter sp. ZZT-01]WRR94502.1 4Fe-4S dicluster domain-containing protein [Sinanaerobacter sp. ZZT-01]
MAKKIASISNECVACGSCLKVCPLHAISIFKGSLAVIDDSKCVGCGKCQKACPASVIHIVDRKEI